MNHSPALFARLIFLLCAGPLAVLLPQEDSIASGSSFVRGHPSAQENERASALYAAALRSLAREDYSKAEVQLSELLRHNVYFQSPSGRSTWYWLARLNQRRGNKQAAIITLEKGLDTLSSRDLTDWHLNYDLARLYAENDVSSKAREMTRLVYQVFRNSTPETQPELWERIIDDMHALFTGEQRSLLMNALVEADSQPGRLLLHFFCREDPSPLTEENEFLAVFFKRTLEARQRFSSPDAPGGYDDRGAIYVRFGRPYSVISSHGGMVGDVGYKVYPYEIWFYKRIDPDLYYTFARLSGKSDYVMVEGPESLFGTFYRGQGTFGSRKNVGETVMSLRDDLYTTLAGQHENFRRRVFELSNFESPREAWHYSRMNFVRNDREHTALIDSIAPPVVYRVGDYYEELPLSFSMAQFRGPDGRTRTEVYYGILNESVGFRRVANGYRADLLGHIAIFDEHYELVSGEYLTESCFAETEGQIEQGSCINQRKFFLRPDHYNLVLTLKDTARKSLGVVRSSFTVNRFATSSLGLSDVQLSTSISEAKASNQFVKNGYLIVPLPNRTIREGESLFIYYETYNLSLEETGVARYKIEYRVRAPRARRSFLGRLFGGRERREPALSLTEIRSGDSPNALEYVQLDLSKLGGGEKVLEIVVTDLISAERRSKEVTFQLRK